ncbi:SLAM family member 9 [Labeo rohita]|uniref:SLAM family member 9 n=1 Tax=Labeo rohita TaxID=84645 RepID=A0ABQ8L103_LABRO|nr:SLAM family member 9 [Labeo rohita]
MSCDGANVSVTEGEDVTLKPAYKINKGDEIQWLFGDKKHRTRISEIREESRRPFIDDYKANERFRDRLDLDKTTGSLTIKNTRTDHSGLYKLHIRTSRKTLQKTFIVTVYEKVEVKSVNEDSVTLNPDTEIQRDDQILWIFGDEFSLIAQIKAGTGETYDGADGRFRGRLELNKETGSLTITDFTTKHNGPYKLLISSSSRGTSCKKFRVSKHRK